MSWNRSALIYVFLRCERLFFLSWDMSKKKQENVITLLAHGDAGVLHIHTHANVICGSNVICVCVCYELYFDTYSLISTPV